MGIRRWLLSQLDRGERPMTDPDEPVELADVNVWEGPMLMRALDEAGIDAEGFEAMDIVTRSITRFRILVRRRDLEHARVVEAEHR